MTGLKQFVNGYKRLDFKSSLLSRSGNDIVSKNSGDLETISKFGLQEFEKENLDLKLSQKIFIILNYMATFANLRFTHLGEFEYQNDKPLNNNNPKLSIFVEYDFSFDEDGNRWDNYQFLFENSNGFVGQKLCYQTILSPKGEFINDSKIHFEMIKKPGWFVCPFYLISDCIGAQDHIPNKEEFEDVDLDAGTHICLDQENLPTKCFFKQYGHLLKESCPVDYFLAQILLYFDFKPEELIQYYLNSCSSQTLESISSLKLIQWISDQSYIVGLGELREHLYSFQNIYLRFFKTFKTNIEHSFIENTDSTEWRGSFFWNSDKKLEKRSNRIYDVVHKTLPLFGTGGMISSIWDIITSKNGPNEQKQTLITKMDGSVEITNNFKHKFESDLKPKPVPQGYILGYKGVFAKNSQKPYLVTLKIPLDHNFVFSDERELKLRTKRAQVIAIYEIQFTKELIIPKSKPNLVYHSPKQKPKLETKKTGGWDLEIDETMFDTKSEKHGKESSESFVKECKQEILDFEPLKPLKLDLDQNQQFELQIKQFLEEEIEFGQSSFQISYQDDIPFDDEELLNLISSKNIESKQDIQISIPQPAEYKDLNQAPDLKKDLVAKEVIYDTITNHLDVLNHTIVESKNLYGQNIIRLVENPKNVGYSVFDPEFEYRVNKEIDIGDFDSNSFRLCSKGIHFFLLPSPAIHFVTGIHVLDRQLKYK